MMMFGLSVVGAITLLPHEWRCLGADGVRIAGSQGGYVISVGEEWTTFVALVLGWLAAMTGASTEVKQDVVSRQPAQMQCHAA